MSFKSLKIVLVSLKLRAMFIKTSLSLKETADAFHTSQLGIKGRPNSPHTI